MQQPFVSRNHRGQDDSFDEVGSAKPGAERDHEKQGARNIADVIDSPATFRLEKLGARDLAVAAIEHAVELINQRAEQDAEVAALPKKIRGQHGQNKDGKRPTGGRDVRVQEPPGEGTSKWSVDEARDDAVLRLSRPAKKFIFRQWDVVRRSHVAPALADRTAPCEFRADLLP